MVYITWALFVYALALAGWYGTWLEAVVIGGAAAGVVTWVYAIAKGTLVCRITVASALMVLTALHIHQAHGMIEMHFGVFALLAMLLYYRDWIPIVVAAAVIAVHHVLFYAIQASGSSVYILASDNVGFWVIALHAVYVVVEAGLLVWFAINLRAEALQSTELMNTTGAIVSGSEIDLTRRTIGTTELLRKFDGYTSDVEALATEVKHTSIDLEA